MISTLKAITKKIFLLSSGKYRHLKVAIHIPKQWYGNKYGGYFACPRLINKNSVVYSFGIGEDISFDDAIISAHNCRVFGFDPTPKSIAWVNNQTSNLPSNFIFNAYGISDKSGTVEFYLPNNEGHISGSMDRQGNVNVNRAVTVEMRSIEDIMRQLQHDRIDVLKLDIEGSEYKVLEHLLDREIFVGQILVELHERFYTDGTARTILLIEKLKAHNFEMFGISDSFQEVSFINKGLL